jgi:LPXTG-site transpeptidase (sortase) family protein
MIAGGAMLACYALVAADGYLSQQRARRALDTHVADHLSSAVESHASSANQAIERNQPVVPRHRLVGRGEALADLSIPRVRLSAVVLQGSDARTLRRGPGHLENTAFPDEPGNVVIAGHRDTFFRPLRDVKVSDDVILRTPYGDFQYRVESTRVTTARDLSVLAPAARPVLTLITCYPFWVFGEAPDRFVVRATRVGDRLPAHEGRSDDFAIPRTPQRPAPAVISSAAALAPSLPGSRTLEQDETLVRQSIERFRQTYNARLLRRGEGDGGTLTFAPCEVIAAADRAIAVCAVGSTAAPAPARAAWTFALTHGDAGWAIKSIATQ